MKVGPLVGDRFEIDRQIGTGGMGEVYRGLDRTTGEQVAIKVISDGRDHRTVRFAREVETLAQLSHPGIVRYITSGETPTGAPFLAMEWLDGEDLKARLERAPLSVGEAVKLTTRVAEALGAAHARGIVHRDLKPSNLFLPGGRIADVKVIDFGIAQRVGGTQLTQTGMLIGTPGYMAPEQARNRGAVDARADVFALGCVLFMCLTGRPAFDGDSAAGILGAILFSEAPRLRSLWPEAPEELDSLVAQMLAKDPGQRPSNGANLAAALGSLGPLVQSSTVVPSERAVAERPSAITGGERRFLSVVLLGRSTDAVSTPDEVLTLDDAPMQRAIRPHGGRLEALADGSTIVVFEADRQVATDQAAQAARCALAMRAHAGGRTIAVAMGRAASTSHLPESDVIDRASQLVSLAAGTADGVATGAADAIGLSTIALDDISAGLLDARFEVIESDTGLVLCGERPLAQGARTLLGRPTSCVGRDWELNALAGILDECIEESEARVVIVTAAAGMGKSRLGTEFLSRVQQRPREVATWVGRGDSLRAGSTLDLLAQALRGALGLHGGELLVERRDRIRERIAQHVRPAEQQRVAEFLGELVGTPFPNGEVGSPQLKAARQDAQLMSEQMRRAFMDFLEAEAAVRPVLIVLEDLQWGDFGTVRFIDTALRERARRPWMVLALARPEVFEVFPKLWAERQHVQTIRLKELGRKAGERLARQVLGDAVGTETIERLVAQADGNTFYLEELIRAVAEGKDKDGGLPETVLAMVETRLARLPLEARRVLRAASVFGEVAWESGVMQLLGGVAGGAMETTIAGEWLGKLGEQEMLTVRPGGRFPGERELAFRHSLIREGAYATFTESDLRLAHRLAGEWLEQHGETDPMMLAGHFERGGAPVRAATYYLRASEQAFHVLDLEATMLRAGQGIACDPPEELRIALLGMRCEASTQGVHLASATMADAEELIQTAPRGSISWAQGLISYMEGTLVDGRFADLLSCIGMLRKAEPLPEAAARFALPFLAAVCILDSFGQVPEGSSLEERFFEVVRPMHDGGPLAQFWWNICTALRSSYAHEDPWTGLVRSEENEAIYNTIGGERTALNTKLFRALNRWFLGASAAAEELMRPIGAADTSLGVASSLRRFALAWLLADRGALDEARALAAQLAEDGRVHHFPLEESRGRWVLAEVLRRAGDLEGADRELEIAVAMAVPLEQPGVLATLAQLRLAQGRTADAVTAAADAAGRCTAMGGCGMFRGAFVRLAHAEALHAAGAADAARRAIEDARERLHAIAARIGDEGYRRSFLEDVPENARTLARAREWLGEAEASA